MVARLLAIQHRLNPLHVYCRFLDMGLGKRVSSSVCRSYETLVFVWVSWILKVVVHFYCVVNGECIFEQVMTKRKSKKTVWPKQEGF